MLLVNNYIVANGSGGASYRDVDTPVLVNNTIADNGPVGVQARNGTLVNDIVWGPQRQSAAAHRRGELFGYRPGGLCRPQSQPGRRPGFCRQSASRLPPVADFAPAAGWQQQRGHLPATDYDGDPRVIGAAVEMGADETQTYTLALTKTAAPSGLVYPGQWVSYTLGLTDLGPASAGGVLVTDTLPPAPPGPDWRRPAPASW